MRRLVVPLLLPLFVVACGGGDDSLSRDEAEQIVERAQLTVDDLPGDDWEKTADEPVEDTFQDEEANECMGLDPEFGQDILAESNERTFSRSTGELGNQEVSGSITAFASTDDVDAFVKGARHATFRTCLTDALNEELAEEGETEGVTITFDEPDIRIGAVTGAEQSIGVTIELDIEAEALTVRSRAELLFLFEGQIGTVVKAFSVDELLTRRDVEALALRMLDKADL